MKPQRTALTLLLIALAGCGERAPADLNAQGSTTPAYERVESEPLLDNTQTPVRIGELGSGFPSCSARGTIRERVATGPVPVRAAPFEQAQETDQLSPSARFFICSRTHDQRWFGIVYDEGGQATERCGVSASIPSRQTYSGPCATGWVASAAVRMVSSVPDPLPQGTPPTD